MSNRAWLAAKRSTRLVPVETVFPIFDPVLNVAMSVVHLDHLPGRKLGIGRNKPDPWKECNVVPLDLDHHSMPLLPGLCLVPEINRQDLNRALRGQTHGGSNRSQ